MSAIFGKYNIDGKPIQPSLLESMSEILSHRGNDDTGIWIDRNIGLGHRMLWTSAESLNEKLPRSIDGNNLVITADARIDNRDELIKQLDLSADSSDETISDSEIILYSYKKWGEDCPKKLLGDFAFVIWDRQNSKVFCVRDHFGVRPFYYYMSSKLLAFATEIKALLVIPEIPVQINEIKLANHLAGTFKDKFQTFYKNIFRLEPGHCLITKKGSTRTIQYYNLELPQEFKLKSDYEFAEALREKFSEAVECRLRGDVPTGSMLSGGIDSSSITCVARNLLAKENKKLHTFSGVFNHVKECDERQYINTILSKNSIKPHFVVADEIGPYVDIDKVVDLYDEPISYGNLYINWHSYKIAQQQGIKIILDGWDGDTTLSHGLGLFPELAHKGQWGKLILENIAYAKKINENWGKSAWSWIWYAGLKPWISKNYYTSQTRKFIRRAKNKVGIKRIDHKQKKFSVFVKLNPDFQKRVELKDLNESHKFINPLTERQNHLMKVKDNGNPFTLEVLNCAAGVFSIETRFPFWDKRLVEFCLSLPASQKIKKGWTRLVMRRAMEGILPPEIQWRGGKSNIAPSVKYGMLKFGKELIDNTLIKNIDIICDYVDVKSLQDSCQRLLESQASMQDINRIQYCISLTLWLQKLRNV